jgi:hypothetical protein
MIKSRRMRWAGRVAHVGRGKYKAYRTFVEKPEGKTSVGEDVDACGCIM